MAWIYVAVAAALAGLAAWRLAPRGYHQSDDVVHRRIRWWAAPVVAAVGAVLAGPFFAPQPPVVVVTYLLALVWGVVLAMIDLEVRRLPDWLTLPAYPVAAAGLAACSAVTSDWPALLVAAACAGGSVAVYLLAALVSADSGGLGLGDVKLAGVLGGLLGWIGWLPAVMGLLTGFIFGGVLAVALLVVRRADRKSHISFGPSMIIAAYLWCVLTVGT